MPTIRRNAVPPERGAIGERALPAPTGTHPRRRAAADRILGSPRMRERDRIRTDTLDASFCRSRSPPRGADDLRREGPGHVVPADRAAAPAGRRAERAGRPARRRRLRRVERVRRPVRDADRRAPRRRRAEVHPLPHDGAVLADARGAADRPQPPHGRHGRHHRDRHLRAGLQLDRARTPCAPLAETLKLNGYSTAQFGKCHEVPVWETSPIGPVRRLADRRGGFEYFYGFIGGETNQYYPALYEGTTPVEPDRTPEEGYHFMADMTDKAIELGPPAEGADARQAVLHVLRAGRDARPAPRAQGVGGQVQGQLRRRAGTRCARRPSRARRSSA